MTIYYNAECINRLSLSQLIQSGKLYFLSENDDLIENLILLHIFNDLRKYYYKDLKLGFSHQFEFLNTFLDDEFRLPTKVKDELVIIQNLLLDERKIPFWKRKINYLNKITGINDLKLTPIKSFTKPNPESDIIGICININSQTGDIHIKVKNCISNMRLSYHEYYCIKKNTHNIPRPFNVLIKNTQVRVPFKQPKSLLNDLKKLKFFVGNMNEVFLLAYLILGKNNCVLLETNEYPETYLTFFENVINLGSWSEEKFIYYFTEMFQQEINE